MKIRDAHRQLLKPFIQGLYAGRGRTIERVMWPLNVFFYFHLTVISLLAVQGAVFRTCATAFAENTFQFRIPSRRDPGHQALDVFTWFLIFVRFFNSRKMTY